MSKTTFTYTCRTCGEQVSVKCVGILQPFAEPLAGIQSLAHVMRHHMAGVGLGKWCKMVLLLLWKCLKMVVTTLLVILRAAMYVFYPIYLLLRIIYNE